MASSDWRRKQLNTNECNQLNMMNKISFLLGASLGLASAFPLHAQQTRYISDELVTYTHSGPGEQYRIVGTLNAGDTVTVLSVNTTAGYAQVRDEKGRTGWLSQNQLSQTPSLKTRVPELETQVSTLTEKLNSLDQQWSQRTAALREKVASTDTSLTALQQENQTLKNQLTVAQKQLDAANLQLDEKQRTLIMQWFMYGGGIAGSGLFLGLALPYFMPRRRKNNRWMG